MVNVVKDSALDFARAGLARETDIGCALPSRRFGIPAYDEAATRDGESHELELLW